MEGRVCVTAPPPLWQATPLRSHRVIHHQRSTSTQGNRDLYIILLPCCRNLSEASRRDVMTFRFAVTATGEATQQLGAAVSQERLCQANTFPGDGGKSDTLCVKRGRHELKNGGPGGEAFSSGNYTQREIHKKRNQNNMKTAHFQQSNQQSGAGEMKFPLG